MFPAYHVQDLEIKLHGKKVQEHISEKHVVILKIRTVRFLIILVHIECVFHIFTLLVQSIYYIMFLDLLQQNLEHFSSILI